MCSEYVYVETPSYLEFQSMDREECDPEDVAEILDICCSEEE